MQQQTRGMVVDLDGKARSVAEIVARYGLASRSQVYRRSEVRDGVRHYLGPAPGRVRPGYLVDLDGMPRHIGEIAARENLTRAAIYARSELRDGVRYFRQARRPGWPRGKKRAA